MSKLIKKLLSAILVFAVLAGFCCVSYAADETKFYEHQNFYEISMEAADAKFNNGDTFIYILYRPNCINCYNMGRYYFSAWMDSYNATIYGTDVTELNSLPSFIYADYYDKMIVTPLVLFVKNGSYTAVMACYEGVADDLSRAFCELNGKTYVPITSAAFSESTYKIDKGKTQKLTFNIQPSNASIKAIYWESSDPEIATVSQDGVVTAKKGGSVTIFARLAGADYFRTPEEIKYYCRVKVNVPVTGIALPQKNVTLTVGDEMELKPIYTPEDATPSVLYYSSSNKKVVDTMSGRKIKAVAPGTAVVTVYSPDKVYSATCNVTVVAKKVAVTGVSLSTGTVSLEKGKTLMLNYSVSPSNATNKAVTWSSSNSSVATVSSSGLITAKSAGTATVTVKTNDGGYTAKCTVTVTEPKKVNATSVDIIVEKDFEGTNVAELGASVNPASASYKSLVWSSSDTSIATVDSDGTVTTYGAGVAMITVTVTNHDGTTVSDSVEVTVNGGNDSDGGILGLLLSILELLFLPFTLLFSILFG